MHWLCKPIVFGLMIVGFILAVLSPALTQVEEADVLTRVQNEIDAVRGEPNVALRTERMFRLAASIRMSSSSLNDAEIDSVADMLTDKADSVRYWVAIALSFVGVRARRAAPQLRKALSEIVCVIGSKTSEEAIRLAFAKMEIVPPDFRCSQRNYAPPFPRGNFDIEP